MLHGNNKTILKAVKKCVSCRFVDELVKEIAVVVRYILCIAIVALVAGCSNYPRTQDTTGDRTFEIVEKVRCEAQRGLFKTTIDELRAADHQIVYRDGKSTYTGNELAEAMLGGRFYLTKDKLAHFTDDALKRAFKYYKDATIGYEFTLDLQEMNNQALSAVFMRNIPNPAGTIAAGGGIERTRSVQRIFRVVDNFEDLFPKAGGEFCAGAALVDIVYPMRGRNPIHDLIWNFIYTNEYSNLRGTDDTVAVNRMADTIQFTTKLSSNLEPTFTPSILGAGFQLSSIGLTNQNSRMDRHQVIITLSVAPKNREIVRNGVVVARNGLSPVGRVAYANQTIDDQREKNVQDAIVQIGNSLSQIRSFPLLGF